MQDTNSWTNPQVITAIGGAVAVVVAAIGAAAGVILKVVKETRETSRETNNEIKSASVGIVAANNKIDDAANKVVENDRKTDELKEKATQIHDQVNGNLSILQAKVEEYRVEIIKLERQLRVKSEKLSEALYTKYGLDRREALTGTKRITKKK